MKTKNNHTKPVKQRITIKKHVSFFNSLKFVKIIYPVFFLYLYSIKKESAFRLDFSFFHYLSLPNQKACSQSQEKQF